MIEARLRNDQFEGMSSVSRGIPSEGVIVYEVRNTTDVYLRTGTALGNGQSLEIDNEGLRIRVQAEIPGGFTVEVNSKGKNQCELLWNQIASLQLSLKNPIDLQDLKNTISALQKAKARARSLHCNFFVNPPDVAVLEKTFGAPSSKEERQDRYDPKAK